MKDWCTLFDQIRRDRALRGEQKTTWENRERKKIYSKKVDWRRERYNRKEHKRQTDRGVVAIKMGPTVWWPARRTGG